jgi:hypothetical protein
MDEHLIPAFGRILMHGSSLHSSKFPNRYSSAAHVCTFHKKPVRNRDDPVSTKKFPKSQLYCRKSDACLETGIFPFQRDEKKNAVFWDVKPCGSCQNLSYSEASVLTRATRSKIPEDFILHSPRSETSYFT